MPAQPSHVVRGEERAQELQQRAASTQGRLWNGMKTDRQTLFPEICGSQPSNAAMLY